MSNAKNKIFVKTPRPLKKWVNRFRPHDNTNLEGFDDTSLGELLIHNSTLMETKRTAVKQTECYFSEMTLFQLKSFPSKQISLRLRPLWRKPLLREILHKTKLKSSLKMKEQQWKLLNNYLLSFPQKLKRF